MQKPYTYNILNTLLLCRGFSYIWILLHNYMNNLLFFKLIFVITITVTGVNDIEFQTIVFFFPVNQALRSEERRGGKEC